MSGRRVQRSLRTAVLRWSRERAGLGTETIAARIEVKQDRVLEWERSGRISMSQVDRLAHYTHTPVGYLYLREPRKTACRYRIFGPRVVRAPGGRVRISSRP